jgi:hypothetical protein
MQVAGATMMVAPPPLMAPPSSLVVGSIPPATQSVRPMLAMTQAPAQSNQQYHHHQSLQQQQQQPPPQSAVPVTRGVAVAPPTVTRTTQQQHQTPVPSRSPTSTSSSSASTPHHQPTSAVSAVTEMLKRKLQQRLLAETAKKRCLQGDGAATDADGKQSSADGAAAASKTDFVVDVWNKNVAIVGPSAASRSAPRLPTTSGHQQHVNALQPVIVSPTPAAKLPPAQPVIPSLSIADASTLQNYTGASLPNASSGTATGRKQKKKFKRKTSAKASAAKITADTAAAISASSSATGSPTVVSGALFAGNCAPILTLPSATQPTPVAAATPVAGAMAAATFGCRKLNATSVGGVGNGATNPVVFVGSSGMATGLCAAVRCPQPPAPGQLSLGNVSFSRADLASASGVSGPIAAVSLATAPAAGWSSAVSDVMLSPYKSTPSDEASVGGVAPPIGSTSTGTAAAFVSSDHHVGVQNTTNGLPCHLAASSSDTTIGKPLNFPNLNL